MSTHRFAIKTIFYLAMWASVTGSLAAEEAPPANGTPAHMVVTVEAVHGSNVPVIGREDVLVYEGRDRDKVTDWVPAQGDHAGLELVVMLDDGSNISLGTQLEDLRQFITAQPASTKIGVAYMQNGIAKMEQNLTSDHALAAKALRLPMGIHGINGSPYFSLSDLIKRWPETTARREVLMVSDGIDLYYGSGDLLDPYLAAAIEDAQRAGVVVFVIYTPGGGHYGHSYWRTYWGQLYLAQVAEETGGESYYIGFFGPPVAFTPYLDNMEHRLTCQYLLTFTAKPQKKSGLQRVKLMTEVPNAELVSAERVYVAAGAP
ncbi:MAG TPA: hypothetical protein VE957_10190 [Terriglobales bacterium]|nr:hypothetical protein [Terriglobales bacterium]